VSHYYAVVIYRNGDTIKSHETIGSDDQEWLHRMADEGCREIGADTYEILHTCFECMMPFTTQRIAFNGGLPRHMKGGCE
jgi:hypothetical protein